MSNVSIQILETTLKSFFSKEGQIADVLQLLSKREKFYLYERLNIASEDSWLPFENKIKVKIDAINSLLLFVIERPQLDGLLNTTIADRANQTILIKLYNLVFDLSIAQLPNYANNDFEKIEAILLTAIYGVCADRTPEVAVLIQQNNSWITNFTVNDEKLNVRLATYKFNLSLYAKITSGSHIQEINRLENITVDAFNSFQKSESSKDNISMEAGFSIGTFANLIHVLRNMKEYLFTGKPIDATNIHSIIETYIFNALTLSKNLEQDIFPNIIHHSKYSLDQLQKNSIWQIADRSPLIKSYFEKSFLKGEQLLLTLLPSQRKTILDILTAKKSVVINMPTSAGKSLLAELYILYTMQSQSYKGFEPTVAYVVPTNALINQVKYRLRRIFDDYRIESVLPFYEEDSFEEEFLDNSSHIHILVTTPEKLDFLVRNDRPVIKNLKLLILDEAHNLSDKGRGSKFELLLSVIKQKKSDVNFLLLSPFIKNAKEIAKWLGDTEENSTEVSITWTPTKQYVGCNTINAKKDESIITYFPTPRNTIVEDSIEIPLSVNLKNLKVELNETKINSIVKTIGLLERYLKLGETTLVFCQGPGSAQSMAIKAKNYFVSKGYLKDCSDDPAIQRALTLIKYDSKADDPLIDCIKHGVAYHHSQISSLIKEEIEKLIAKGSIKLVCATPTLAQGMNFPITTVIFETTKLGKNAEDMPTSVFWNIAGRAGRAFMDNEGHIIVGYTISNENTIQKTKNYIIGDIKEITSSLNAFFKEMDGQIHFNYQLIKENPSISNFLQYLNHIIKVAYHYNLNVVDTSQIRTILNNSLFYRQISFEQGFLETQKKINDFALGYISHLKGENKSLLSLADVFGISNISLNSVTARVIDLQKQIQADYSPQEFEKHFHASQIILGTKSVSDLAKVVTVLSRIPELKVAMREGGALDPDTIATVIIGWVNGETVSSIAEKTRKNKEKIEDAIGICNKYINGNLRNYLPWGFNIYQTLSNDHDSPDAKMLPSFIYYGVNDKESVILASIGIPRFIIPNVRAALNRNFGEPITMDNLDKVKQSLKTIDDFGIGDSSFEKRKIKEMVNELI